MPAVLSPSPANRRRSASSAKSCSYSTERRRASADCLSSCNLCSPSWRSNTVTRFTVCSLKSASCSSLFFAASANLYSASWRIFSSFSNVLSPLPLSLSQLLVRLGRSVPLAGPYFGPLAISISDILFCTNASYFGSSARLRSNSELYPNFWLASPRACALFEKAFSAALAALIAASAMFANFVVISCIPAPTGLKKSPKSFFNLSSATVIRAPASSVEFASFLAIGSYCLSSAATNFIKSASPTVPSCKSFDSCGNVRPVALANRVTAPGRRSPSWPCSSSADTFPLLNTCDIASNELCTSSALPPVALIALLTPRYTSSVSVTLPPAPLTAAASLVIDCVASNVGTLKSLLADAITCCACAYSAALPATPRKAIFNLLNSAA